MEDPNLILDYTYEGKSPKVNIWVDIKARMISTDATIGLDFYSALKELWGISDLVKYPFPLPGIDGVTKEPYKPQWKFEFKNGVPYGSLY